MSVKIALPSKVVVKRLENSRYADNLRPAGWDQRTEGIDQIECAEFGSLRLLSDGSQSPPQAGWTLILTSGDEQAGYRWTLYGLSREQQASAS